MSSKKPGERFVKTTVLIEITIKLLKRVQAVLKNRGDHAEY